ncbi:hypothetical protein GCM10010259_24570 [Streptomyces daghestanicus]|uniref:Chaplin domain-containing protein n=1 Tax=Streptomyces daghestanicus TaxID=66885 RepID=A0ABQ3QA81_9ACTN|nr:hypothetical protein GCM10010240_00360 [Streptomyces griseoviridis]GGU33235.1 hypothetical protein GCM10010259_24570 [Streptomyces daghestanicus]GHI34165.1 hypothetical protein Sdagh_58950 [Streptomyces daghestanicus]
MTTAPSPARRHRSPPPSVSPRGAGGGDLTSKGDPLSKDRAATDGGGVPNLGAVPHAGPLTGNSPPGKGGGLASKDIVSPMAGATATFTGGTVSDNTCTGRGGGIHNGLPGRWHGSAAKTPPQPLCAAHLSVPTLRCPRPAATTAKQHHDPHPGRPRPPTTASAVPPRSPAASPDVRP